MLRVVRFAARLQFDLESDTESAIASARTLLRDIPPARLFDEWLKLFMNGFSAPTFTLLRSHELLDPLMGEAVSDVREGEPALDLQQLALANTDRRVADGRPVTPAFLLAALYWPAVEARAEQLAATGESPIPAMHSAGQQVVQQACQHLAIPSASHWQCAISGIFNLAWSACSRRKLKTTWPIAGSARHSIYVYCESKPMLWEMSAQHSGPTNRNGTPNWW